MSSHNWFWIALVLLGAYHGINPGMGWLFAVSLGLQERSREAVLRALPPIVLGHLLSVACVVAAVVLLQAWVPQLSLRIIAAAILLAYGILRLVRARHPRWANWVGMRVNFRNLTFWSFLMASAHGAGLMLLPFILGMPGQASHPTMADYHMVHAMALASSSSVLPGSVHSALWLFAVGFHTLGFVLVAGSIAVLVYEKLGVAILRRAWFNLDILWAAALVMAGAVTLFV